MESSSNVIESVRRALGRVEPLAAPPKPPVIDEMIIRLVHTEVGLPELFTRIARENKISVSPVGPDELADELIAFLRSNHVKSIALPVSPLLKKLGVVDALRAAGFDARTWDQMSLDDVYEVDCGITDVWAAVAEVGALVVGGSAGNGGAISLVPNIHVAIIEPKNIVPDLVDLFEKLPPDQNDKWVIITGPSKTADIEMNLVTGVHGPGVVKVFVLG